MSVFDYKLSRRDQLVRKGEAIDNNIDFSGRTNTDFTNKFVAKMRDTNNLYTRESPGQFNDQRADVVRKELTKFLTSHCDSFLGCFYSCFSNETTCHVIFNPSVGN